MIANKISSIQQLDQLCNKVCFQTNYSEKMNAEGLVSQLVNRIILGQFEELESIVSQTSSQTTIFVISEYLTKIMASIPVKNLIEIVEIMVLSIKNWYKPETREMIRGWDVLQKHTINSIWNMIGEGIKKIIIEQTSLDSQFLLTLSFNNDLGLIAWKQITKIVGTVNQGVTFYSFQGGILYYQNNITPLIIDFVNPYFATLTQTLKMNELVMMQDNLTIENNENLKQEVRRLLTFSEEQLIIAKSVLELIQVILEFPYNISYAQYDCDYNAEQSTIYFTEHLSDKIFKTDFYDSLFLLTERFILEMPSHPLLPVCLNCLKRIMMAKVISIDSQIKNNFIKKSLSGLTKIMNILKKCQKSLEIIDLNNRLLGNISLKKFRKYQDFLMWLPLIEIHIFKNMFSQPLQLDSIPYAQCYNLLQKLHKGFENTKMQDYKATFRYLSHKIFCELITKLLTQQEQLSMRANVSDYKQAKSYLDDFFDTVKQILNYNLQSNLPILLHLQTMLLDKSENQIASVNPLFNLNLLVSTLFQYPFLRQLNSIEQNQETTKNTLKTIYQNQIQFVNKYFIKYRTQNPNAHLQFSVMILLETLSTQLCSNISFSGEIKGKQKNLNHSSKMFDFVEAPTQNAEKLLNDYISFISFSFISSNRLQIYYALAILNSCMIRMKWTMNRKHFKSLEIVKDLMKFCTVNHIPRTNDKQLMKCRMEIIKLVCTIGFDDALDSFKKQLNSVLNNLDVGNIGFLIFQLRGLAERIDSTAIYKYFLQKACYCLSLVLSRVCFRYLQDQSVLKNSLKLFMQVFTNQPQRINPQSKSVRSICQLSLKCTPYFQTILSFLEKAILVDPDKYASSVAYLIGSFCRMIDGTYVNIYDIQQVNSQIQKYIFSLLIFVNKITRSELINYVKIKNQILNFCKCIFQHLSQYLYNKTTNIFMNDYCHLYTFGLVLFHEKLNSENKNQFKDEEFDKAAQFVNEGIKFQSACLMQIHNSQPLSKAVVFKQVMRQKLIQMLLIFVRTTIASTLSFRRIQQIAVFTKYIVKIYEESAEQIFTVLARQHSKSNYQILKQFILGCLKPEDKNLSINFTKWLESTKQNEDLDDLDLMDYL